MLSFEEKKRIIESFPELTRKEVSLGRVNYHYEESAQEKKTVVYHLHPNGNGFVYGALLSGRETDDRGMINIRDSSEEELRALVQASIRSLAPKTQSEQAVAGDVSHEERWIGPDNQTLLLVEEDDLWYVYSGLNLEMAFDTYDEAEAYLKEEGFARP